MEPLWLKLIISSAGAFVILIGGWIKYMQSKLTEIVPRDEIQKMIAMQLLPGEVRTLLVKEKLDHIEEQLDSLRELLLDVKQRPKGDK